MTKFAVSCYRKNKNNRYVKMFYTGISLNFSTKLEDAILYDDLPRAVETVNYLRDCNMDPWVVQVNMEEAHNE